MRSKSRRLIVSSLVIPLGLSTVAAACGDDAPPVKLSAQGREGELVAKELSCAGCHSADGDELYGPTWKGLYGSTITLKGGKKITVDDEYIERAIRDPNAERREDAGNAMPMFDEDRLSADQLADLIAYIKDLSA